MTKKQPEHLDEVVAKNIKDLRLKNGLSQLGLAELAGVHQPDIARIERTGHAEKSSPTVRTLKRIATALNTTVSELTKEG